MENKIDNKINKISICYKIINFGCFFLLNINKK